jgi:hypothetical protein
MRKLVSTPCSKDVPYSLLYGADGPGPGFGGSPGMSFTFMRCFEVCVIACTSRCLSSTKEIERKTRFPTRMFFARNLFLGFCDVLAESPFSQTHTGCPPRGMHLNSK